MNNETEIHNLIQQGVFTTSMNRKVCWENGYKKGKEEAKKEFIETIDDWLDSYPIDIFPEITIPQLEEINEFCKNECDFTLDRLSAHIGRRILNGLKQQLKGEGEKE